jgi:DNA repair protein RadD
MFELRSYQRQAIDLAYQRIAEEHRPIICAATGSGKTVIAGQIAKEAMDAGKQVLWVTGREEILKQTFATFNEMCGRGNVGILMAKEKPWWFYPKVTVASWDTLKARWNKSDTWHIPADVFLIDEAHLSLSEKMSQTIMPHYQSKTVIGFTATPARRTGRGLGSYFTRIIQIRSIQQLIDEGFLAPCEYWAGSHVDTSKLRVDRTTNDYQEQDLGRAALDGKLIGDVLDNWLRLAKERHTIVFAVNIAHAQALAERFQAAGIAAEVVHSKMAHETRQKITDQFRAREVQVLVNVGICSYGFDCPSVNCIVLARPTKSIVMHHQAIGRGIRPKPDGGYCVILDHADNVRRLGCIEDEIRWRLGEGKEAATNTTREGDADRGKAPNAPPTECESCHHMFARSRVCPKCGWEKPQAARDIETVQADLVKVRKSRSDLVLEPQDKHKWFRMAWGWCEAHGKRRGMAYFRFKDKFGEEPARSWWRGQPMAPDERVASYMQAGLIRFAKSRRRQGQKRARA